MNGERGDRRLREPRSSNLDDERIVVGPNRHRASCSGSSVRSAWAVGAICLMLTVPSLGGTIIDFSVYPDGSRPQLGDEITTQYEPWGVIFSSRPGSEATTVTELNDFGGRTLLFPGGPAPERGGTLLLRFTNPVTSVSSGLSNISPDLGPLRIVAFEPHGAIVAHQDIRGSRPEVYWSLTNPYGLSRIELIGNYFSYPGQPDGWGIFDLEFTPMIPEPGTGMLLLLGLAAVTCGARRAFGWCGPATRRISSSR